MSLGVIWATGARKTAVIINPNNAKPISNGNETASSEIGTPISGGQFKLGLSGIYLTSIGSDGAAVCAQAVLAADEP